jgi:hypothetical protein
MKRFGLIMLIGVLLLISSVVYAQEDTWLASDDGTVEYNCDTLAAVLDALNEIDIEAMDELGNTAIARADGTEISVYEFIGSSVANLLLDDSDQALTSADVFAPAANVCSGGLGVEADDETATAGSSDFDSFNVIANSNANMRSCGSTECEIVGQTTSGSLLVVVGESGDWYEVEHDGGTAFIASWLTVRGPDDVIYTDEVYVDSRTGCRIIIDPKRGEMDMNFILSGDRRDDVIADISRPDDTGPLNVEGQLDKTFIDTGDPYIHQYYSWNIYWPLGIYQIEISLDGATTVLAWEVESRADHNIFVLCD